MKNKMKAVRQLDLYFSALQKIWNIVDEPLLWFIEIDD